MGSLLERDSKAKYDLIELYYPFVPKDIIQILLNFCIVIEEQITPNEFLMIDYSCYGLIIPLQRHGSCTRLCFHISKYRDDIKSNPIKLPSDFMYSLLRKYNFLDCTFIAHCSDTNKKLQCDDKYLKPSVDVSFMLISEFDCPRHGFMTMNWNVLYIEMAYDRPEII